MPDVKKEGTRIAKIRVPAVDLRYTFSAKNTDTGEVLECIDIAPLFRQIAADPSGRWVIQRERVW